MKQIEVCQLDDNGNFVGTTFADESPLEPGIYLIPRNAVIAEIPEVPQGFVAKYENDSWVLVELQNNTEIPQEQKQPSIEEQNRINETLRANAYRQEADPVFFKSQRGEATNQQWLDKVQEIKERYPVLIA